MCEYAGAAPGLVLPAVCQFSHLQKNCISLSTSLSSSLTAEKRFVFSFPFPLCRTADVYNWSSDRLWSAVSVGKSGLGELLCFRSELAAFLSPMPTCSSHFSFHSSPCVLSPVQGLAGAQWGLQCLTLILLFPSAIFFGFTVLVGGLWGEHTTTAWFKGNIKL